MGDRTAMGADTTLPTQKSYINGEYVSNQDGATFETRHPGNDKQICEIEVAGQHEVDGAVKAASEAFEAWPGNRFSPRPYRRIAMAVALATAAGLACVSLAWWFTGNNGEQVEIVEGHSPVETEPSEHTPPNESKVEEKVKDSSTQWDDVLVIPLLKALRAALGVPDNDVPPTE